MSLVDLYSTRNAKVWVADEHDGYVLAKITEFEVDQSKDLFTLHLETDDGGVKVTQSISLSLLQSKSTSDMDVGLPLLKNPQVLESVDDLTSLTYLHEAAVLSTVKTRYLLQHNIYTYSGIVLIAVNPFASLNIYHSSVAEQYQDKKRGELEPHLYAIAEEAYRDMVQYGRNQSIIVSGMSGAGKTVSAKYIMRYIANVNHEFSDLEPKQLQHQPSSARLPNTSNVEQQVLATNPLMESFGNAKTTRNDNSSRFGKYIEIQFASASTAVSNSVADSEMEIVGAVMRTYLIERSRVVFQPENERNYHIFYQLCSEGVPSAEQKELGLQGWDHFHYLNQGRQGTIQNVDDAAEFESTIRALSTIGISVTVQWSIFRLLAAILHLGNVQLSAQDKNQDASVIKLDFHDNQKHLEYLSKLLGISFEEFCKRLCRRVIVTRGEKIESSLNTGAAVVNRDSVAKFLYTSLFDWLVGKVNSSLSMQSVSGSASQKVKNFIGVLDIYGFEHFELNSFEQFCINYANEKLHHQFNQHVFKLEQEEYVKEKIEWTFINFRDNVGCIQLIEGKLGILDLLDEECRLGNSGNDASFVQKLYKQFEVDIKQAKKNESTATAGGKDGKSMNTMDPKHYFQKPRFSNVQFSVEHYALPVVYTVDNFLEKNKDSMPEEIFELLSETSNQFLKSILDINNQSQQQQQQQAKASPQKAGPAKRGGLQKPTLGSVFKLSLHQLSDTIGSTEVHYIRCIKPNEDKQPFQVDSPYVLEQLRACGVLETIRISCAGYPSRFLFRDFIDRYWLLGIGKDLYKWKGNSLNSHNAQQNDNVDHLKDVCVAILKCSLKDADRFQVGISKVFLRAGVVAYLEKLRSDTLFRAAVMIQKSVKCGIIRKKYLSVRKSTLLLQRVVRGHLARRLALTMRRVKSAIVIQKNWRRFAAMKKYRSILSRIVELQSAIRIFKAKRQLQRLKLEHSVLTIQRVYRGHLSRVLAQKQLRKIVLVQCIVRRHQARVLLKKLRMEAKSVSHIQQKAGALERKVIELTQLLSGKEDELERLKKKFHQQEQQILQLKEKLVQKDDKMKSLAQEVKDLQSKIDHANSVHQKERDTLALEISTLKQQNQVLIQEAQKAVAPPGINTANKLSKQASDVSAQQDVNEKLTVVIMENQQLKEKLAKLFASNRGKSERGLQNSSSSAAISAIPQSPVMKSPSPIHQQQVAGQQVYQATSLFSSTQVSPSDRNSTKASLTDPLLDKELVDVLVVHLVMPPQLPPDTRTVQDVLFPSIIVVRVVVQCINAHLIDRTKLILSNYVRSIQSVIKFENHPSTIYWLSNLIYLIQLLQTLQQDVGLKKDADLNRFLVKFIQDTTTYAGDIFRFLLKDLKKVFSRMVVPAVIEYQGLSGFIDDASNNSGFINRLMGSGAPTVLPTEKLITFLNKLNLSMESYYLEDSIRRQIIVNLVSYCGTACFNQLMVRKNFCTWRRGMQIQYNITRIDEWCSKTGDVPEAAFHLEPLMQSAKLMQLSKSSVEDVDIMFDVCFLLTPVQIRKLLSMCQSNGDYDNPISQQVIKAVSDRCADDRDSAILLEQNEDTALMMPDHLPISDLQCSLPTYLEQKLPLCKKLMSIN
ncbi:hypothetical protein MIR68_001118 [Amoeboaphelidium protococcarum]|nr:hypothetical protein MIR68_001118 [Amoeboaphelidium protococcarum]